MTGAVVHRHTPPPYAKNHEKTHAGGLGGNATESARSGAVAKHKSQRRPLGLTYHLLENATWDTHDKQETRKMKTRHIWDASCKWPLSALPTKCQCR